MCRRLVFNVAVCMITVLAVGCGGSSGPEKVGVSGTVSIDGKPITQGTIAFVSLEGGRTAVTQITDGEYELAKTDGPYPGEQKVTIQAFEKTGRTITVTKDLPGPPDEGSAIPPGGLKLDETKQVLPERYNTKSELKVSLESGYNSDVNFELTTD
ncbi:MAG: hypothetical protein KDA81_20460 [Planctomycetaceae bacterium]|nr:hypothetical protein [Planctomycetaceae bacterium]